jgi:VIT1/CCC1 family predicted Fe2+/Mn2+ transporter
MSRPRREPVVRKDEIEAALAAREELGTELEPHVVDAFIDQIEMRIEARVDEQLARRRATKPAKPVDWSALALAAITMGAGIPITIVALVHGGFAAAVAIAAAWTAILVVNAIYMER